GVDAAGHPPGGLVPPAGSSNRHRRQVTLMKRSPGRFGASLGKSTGWIVRSRLLRAGMREIADVSYDRIDDAGLHFNVDGEKRLLEVDSVVVCAGQESERTLYDELLALGVRPAVVGGAHTALE